MIGDRFRALWDTHGVSRTLISRRTSKIGGLAPEPIPPSDQLPPMVFEAKFLKTGHCDERDIAGTGLGDPYS